MFIHTNIHWVYKVIHFFLLVYDVILAIWQYDYESLQWMNSMNKLILKKSVFIAKLWMWELWRIFNHFYLLLLMWHHTPTSLHRDSDHLVPAVAGRFYLKVDKMTNRIVSVHPCISDSLLSIINYITINVNIFNILTLPFCDGRKRCC